MADSLVQCPMCKGRRQLITIKPLRGEDIRRFRCESCKTETDYYVAKGRIELRRPERRKS